VHEKPNTPRSCLSWKPTGRIFKIAGLKCIPTGKMFTDNTTKVDSQPPNGSNDNITNPYECNQTLNVSASTTNLSAVQASLFNDKMTFKQNGSSLALQQNDVCSHQFRPRSSMTYDVCSHQFRPRSSMTNDVCLHQFRPRLSMTNDASLFNDKMTSVHISSGLALHQQMASADNTSGLYFNPSPSVVQPVLVAVVQEPVVSTGTPSSTRIDQDTPSISTSQTTQEEQSHVIPTSVEEDDHEPSSEESSSRIVIPTNVHLVNQPQEHIEKWTKDHPLDKIIDDPSRPVSTRLQLQTEALFCYYDALLSSSEHKSYKDAFIDLEASTLIRGLAHTYIATLIQILTECP
ncbi:hypothetical protein Tco_1497781, partial [Tanacetum coccineum]